MTPDEKRYLAKLMRRVMIFTADHRALTTLLRLAVAKDQVPVGWESDFEKLQQTVEYRDFVAIHEPMVLKLEQGADLDEVIPLLENIATGKLPN